MKVVSNKLLDPVPSFVIEAGLKKGSSLDLFVLLEEEGQRKKHKIIITLFGNFWSDLSHPFAFGHTKRDKPLSSYYYLNPPKNETEVFEVTFFRLEEKPNEIDFTFANEIGDVYFVVNDSFKELREKDSRVVKTFSEAKDKGVTLNETYVYEESYAYQFSEFTEQVYREVLNAQSNK